MSVPSSGNLVPHSLLQKRSVSPSLDPNGGGGATLSYGLRQGVWGLSSDDWTESLALDVYSVVLLIINQQPKKTKPNGLHLFI